MKYGKISVWQKVCYGLGDFAQNGTYQFIAYYLLYFYTDEMKCSMSAVNAALIAGRAADALATPVMGGVIDLISVRKPRCRIVFLFASVCLNIILPFLFFIPSVSDGTVRMWLIAIYTVYSLSYASANVPYSVLMSSMTRREDERYSLNIFKNLGANLGGAFVSITTLPLVHRFEENGYFHTAVLYALIFAGCSVLCAKFTREVSDGPKRTRETSGMAVCGAQFLTVETIRQVFHNRAWVMLLIVQFLGCTANILHAQSMVYYSKYCLGNEGVSTILIAMGPLTAVMAAFWLPAAARKIGLRGCMSAGNIIMALSLTGIYLSGDNIALTVIMQFSHSMGWACSTGLIYVMVTAAVDSQEAATGKRPQGFMVSAMSLMMKLGSLSGAALGTLILDQAGYTGMNGNAPGVLAALHIEFIWIPAALAFLSGFLALRFKLEKRIRVQSGQNPGEEADD